MKRITILVLIISIFTLAILTIIFRNHSSISPHLIGIVQYVHHPLLDETHRGLVAGLKELGLDDGVKYHVKTLVADKSIQLSSQIVKQFQDEGAVLIIAIATPAAQAAVAQAEGTPIVFAAITDPLAAKLVENIDRPGRNVTGTSNKWPFEQQVSLIPELLPKAKKIGAIWNPGEINSQAAMTFIRPLLEQKGLQINEVPVATTSDVALAARSIADKVDAFLMIPDNTALAATETLVQTAIDSKKPLIGGDIDTVRRGSLATYGYDYFVLGRITAEMVKEILSDKKEPKTMPVRFPPKASLIVNKSTADKLGIEIPIRILEKADEIVK